MTATQDRTAPRKRGHARRAKSVSEARGNTKAALIIVVPKVTGARPQRIKSVLDAVAAAGLTAGSKDKRISSRAHEKLFSAAAEKTGLNGDSELIEYALAKIVLEDDFAERLLARRGTISKDLNLEF